jgi:F-type H+-transporting ATPase subunit b
MDINATLLGQVLVFVILIWFSVKFIWPPLVKAIEDRQKKIAEGLAAAERGQNELQNAHGEAQSIVAAAREQAKKIDAGRGRRIAAAATRDRPQGARRPDRTAGPRDRGRQGLTAAAPAGIGVTRHG